MSNDDIILELISGGSMLIKAIAEIMHAILTIVIACASIAVGAISLVISLITISRVIFLAIKIALVNFEKEVAYEQSRVQTYRSVQGKRSRW